MPIVIPTAGRADVRKQVTMRHLLEAEIDVTLAVPQAQLKEYQKYMPSEVDILPHPMKGISKTRMWLVDAYREIEGGDVLTMMDDDLVFYHRPDMHSSRLVECPDRQLRKMVHQMELLADDYPIVSVSARQGNNHADTAIVKNSRIMNAYTLRLDIMQEHGINFGRTMFMEDFDVTLQMLRAGYDTATLFNYAWNQSGSNKDGGCSVYRTAENHAKAAKKLQRLHPDYVTLVEKKTKTTWKGMEERIDVRIAWKKARAEKYNAT